MMFPFANEICMDDHLFLEARVDQRWSKCPTLSSSYSGGMEGRSSALLQENIADHSSSEDVPYTA